MAYKDLIYDAMVGCTDTIFKDAFLDILAKTSSVLNNEEFEELNFCG